MPWQVLVAECGRVLKARDYLSQHHRVFLPLMREHRRVKQADGVLRVDSFERPLFGPYLFLDGEPPAGARYVSEVLRGANGSGTVTDDAMAILLGAADAEGVIVGRELPKVKNGRCIDFVASVGDLCNVVLASSTLEGIITDLSKVETTGMVGILVDMLGRQCRSEVNYRSIVRMPPSGANRATRRAVQRELA